MTDELNVNQSNGAGYLVGGGVLGAAAGGAAANIGNDNPIKKWTREEVTKPKYGTEAEFDSKLKELINEETKKDSFVSNIAGEEKVEESVQNQVKSKIEQMQKDIKSYNEAWEKYVEEHKNDPIEPSKPSEVEEKAEKVVKSKKKAKSTKRALTDDEILNRTIKKQEELNNLIDKKANARYKLAQAVSGPDKTAIEAARKELENANSEIKTFVDKNFNIKSDKIRNELLDKIDKESGELVAKRTLGASDRLAKIEQLKKTQSGYLKEADEIKEALKNLENERKYLEHFKMDTQKTVDSINAQKKSLSDISKKWEGIQNEIENLEAVKKSNTKITPWVNKFEEVVEETTKDTAEKETSKVVKNAVEAPKETVKEASVESAEVVEDTAKKAEEAVKKEKFADIPKEKLDELRKKFAETEIGKKDTKAIQEEAIAGIKKDLKQLYEGTTKVKGGKMAAIIGGGAALGAILGALIKPKNSD